MKQVNSDKTNVMRQLDSLNINYKSVTYPCDEEHLDGVYVATVLNQDVNQVFKTLITTDGNHHYYVFCIPVDQHLDLKKCAKAAKVKSLAMIHVKEINNVSGYIRGGCSPIGMKKQYPTFIDETAILFDTIFVSGGKRGVQIEINPDDLLSCVQGNYCDLCMNSL